MLRELFNDLTKKAGLFVALAIISFVAYSLCSAALIIVTLDFFKTVSGGDGVSLGMFAVKIFGIVILKGVLYIIAAVTEHQAGFETVGNIRVKLVSRMKKTYQGFFTGERHGELSTIAHKDVANMQSIIIHCWSEMVSDIIVALVIGAGLFILNWKLGIAMAALLPLSVLSLTSGLARSGKLEKITQDDLADMVSYFVEYIRGIPLMKAFCRSVKFEEKLEASVVKFGNSSIKAAKAVAAYIGKHSFWLELSFGAMISAGAFMVYKGSLPVFDLIVFILLSKEFYKPFANLEKYWINFIKGKDSYNRISRVLRAPVIEDGDGEQHPGNFHVDFEDVGFTYQQGEFELKGINFRAEENGMTALVGPSGSGKTTVTNLLMRFWDPQTGRILIGGVDIKQLSYEQLMSEISIVMQDTILFADTIYENIRVGRSSAQRDEVIDAAKQAMIHDFIKGLPDGYETVIGENGVGLSGGQKQRLAIARAFLKEAPIVILDEMTSNIDPVTEVKIQKALSNLAVEKTLIVIAHRLKTIRNSDRIVVFNKGEITEMGSHRELLDNSGLYSELWSAQRLAEDWNIAERGLVADRV